MIYDTVITHRRNTQRGRGGRSRKRAPPLLFTQDTRKMTALNAVSSYPKLAFRGVTWIRTTNKQITAVFLSPHPPPLHACRSDSKLEFSDSWLSHLKTAAETCKHLSVHGGGGKHEHADAPLHRSGPPAEHPTSRPPRHSRTDKRTSRCRPRSSCHLDLITMITIISVSITCWRDKQRLCRRNEP